MCTQVRKIQRSSSMLRKLLHTPTLCYLSGSSPSKSNSSNLSRPSMAIFARIVVVRDIMSSLSIICFYMNPETLALCEMTIFCFFFFEWNLGVLKHNDWICKKIQRHFNCCKYISLTLSTLKNILISFCNLLYIYIYIYIYIYNISYFLKLNWHKNKVVKLGPYGSTGLTENRSPKRFF